MADPILTILKIPLVTPQATGLLVPSEREQEELL
jgi:hypothetical protein